MSNSELPVDLDKLLATYMNNREIIKTIFDAFKESFDNFEADYREAESSGDKELLQRVVHSLKGSSGNLRADDVYELAKDLETKIMEDAPEVEQSESFSKLNAALTELNNYIDNFTV